MDYKSVMSCNCCMVLIVLLLLMAICTEARHIHRNDDSTPDNVEQCRLGCLVKFLYEPSSVIVQSEECGDRPNCAMCWDYCSMLYHEPKVVIKLMCSDFICFSGCKFACNYYRFFVSRPTPHQSDLWE